MSDLAPMPHGSYGFVSAVTGREQENGKMKKSLFVLAALLVMSSFASAAISYPGQIVGVNVIYSNFSEESGTDPGVALYGAPSYGGGDSVAFDDLFFSAYAEGDLGTDTTDGTLFGTVAAKPNHAVDTIKFEEFGDFNLTGFQNNAFVSVTNTIFIKVKEIDFVNVEDFTFEVDMVMTPSDGDWLLTEGGYPQYQGDWSGTLFVDVTQAIIDAGLTGVATDVDFTMDNTLSALSQAGTTAFIAKKETNGLKVTTLDVPEPATLALLGLGGLLLRRKK